MQTYVNQLIKMLQKAHSNRPALRYLLHPEKMKCRWDVIDMDMSLGRIRTYMKRILQSTI
jgi:hypothetical protein